MTHIGKHDLNEDESKWLESYATGVYDRASKDITTALNKQISAEEVKEFLKDAKYSAPKVEEKVEEESEEKSDEEEPEEEVEDEKDERTY